MHRMEGTFPRDLRSSAFIRGQKCIADCELLNANWEDGAGWR